MSAEVLRRAAAGLRDEWADDEGHPRPMGTAWHRERDFHLAVALWLDDTADLIDSPKSTLRYDGNAAAVARAYLGES